VKKVILAILKRMRCSMGSQWSRWKRLCELDSFKSECQHVQGDSVLFEV